MRPGKNARIAARIEEIGQSTGRDMILAIKYAEKIEARRARRNPSDKRAHITPPFDHAKERRSRHHRHLPLRPRA